jgi:predicted DNA-binding transcriptional regulator
MTDEQTRRVFALIERRGEPMALQEIAAELGLDVAGVERSIRTLLRGRRVVRQHLGPDRLAYTAAAGPATRAPAPASAPVAAHGTLTARILDALARHRMPLRSAEVMLLAGLGDDPDLASRVSATLCVLARRGRLRREACEGGGVCYALPDAGDRSRLPLPPRELIDAGFRPAIPREGEAQLALSEWVDPAAQPARLSPQAICQRIRRGWPPELAATLPRLRRNAA